jgi:hypothetical protein
MERGKISRISRSDDYTHYSMFGLFAALATLGLWSNTRGEVLVGPHQPQQRMEPGR